MPHEKKETPEPIVRAFDPQLKTMSSSKVLSPTTSLTDVTPSCEPRIKGWRSVWEGEALKLPHDSTTHSTQLDRHSLPRSEREEKKKKHILTHVIAINCKKVHGECSQHPHKVSQWWHEPCSKNFKLALMRSQKLTLRDSAVSEWDSC